MDNFMMQAIQQLQQLQEKAAQAQKELESMFVTEAGGGELVRVTADGRGRITRLALAPELLASDDREMTEDLIISTINRALDAARSMQEAHMARATSGLMPNIPGLGL